jgi:uncharacterized protein YndB with AHSA1/START domain
MEFQIKIKAPREKVWKTLWSKDTYGEWTAPFSPDSTAGSTAETDWKKGSKVLFLGGGNSGMVSSIAENIPNEFMSFKHLGIVQNGVEDLESEDAKQWAGSFENYKLEATNGGTELEVTMGGAKIPKEFEDYFLNAWPKALDKLKELSEQA